MLSVPPPTDIDRLGELAICLWQTHGDIEASLRCMQALHDLDDTCWVHWRSVIVSSRRVGGIRADS